MKNSLLKILAVDDDQLILWALERAFKGRNLNVKMATTAEQALAEVEKSHFDLFLLDLDLKNPSGLELLHALDESCPYVPIIIMTTSDAKSCELNDAIKDVRRHGAWHLLEKPFSLERILSFIELIFQDEGNVKICLSSLTHNYDEERRLKFRRPHVQQVDFSYKAIIDGVSTRVISRGILTDISDSGSCLLAHEPLQADLVISFEDKSLQQCGCVAWSVMIEEQTYRCGIQFCGISH